MKVLCSWVKLAVDTQLYSPGLPPRWPRGDTNLQHCDCPHFQGGKTEALRARCWGQDRTHLCLGSQLLTS